MLQPISLPNPTKISLDSYIFVSAPQCILYFKFDSPSKRHLAKFIHFYLQSSALKTLFECPIILEGASTEVFLKISPKLFLESIIVFLSNLEGDNLSVSDFLWLFDDLLLL